MAAACWAAEPAPWARAAAGGVDGAAPAADADRSGTWQELGNELPGRLPR
ncbi:MAG: hypothetical protein U0838_13095 [Chloroflexota bacterium]